MNRYESWDRCEKLGWTVLGGVRGAFVICETTAHFLSSMKNVPLNCFDERGPHLWG